VDSTFPYEIDLDVESLRALDGYPPTLLSRASPIIVRKRGQPTKGVGSCFYIGHSSPGSVLFATARHVLREIEGRPEEAFILLLQGAVASGGREEAAVLKVSYICGTQTHSDVAILVTASHPFLPSPPKLDPRCPELGEVCLTLGYSDILMSAARSTLKSGSPTEFHFQIYASQGRIEQVHPRRRDAAMIDFPCFRTDSYYKRGMSGGPIVDGNGSIIGIVSSASDAGFSYGALIALIAELVVSNGSEPDADDISVDTLIRQGAIRFARTDPPVSIRRDDTGVIVRWGIASA
jgi:hypothetical protein